MIKINDGIVFSNDIKLIMEGNNALDYKYDSNLPSSSFYDELRKSFLSEVKRIFNDKVTIISEQEMINSLNPIVQEILKICPHCLS